jgi:hypothetical protein
MKKGSQFDEEVITEITKRKMRSRLLEYWFNILRVSHYVPHLLLYNTFSGVMGQFINHHVRIISTCIHAYVLHWIISTCIHAYVLHWIISTCIHAYVLHWIISTCIHAYVLHLHKARVLQSHASLHWTSRLQSHASGHPADLHPNPRTLLLGEAQHSQ